MISIRLPLRYTDSPDRLRLNAKHPEAACQQKYHSMFYIHIAFMIAQKKSILWVRLDA
jgi:hypothetical protein